MATPTGRYLGVVHFQRLLREPPSALLGGVVDNDIDPLDAAVPPSPRSPAGWRRTTWSCMPVVDDNDRLVGAVTVDDVLDHLLPTTGATATEQRAAGGPARRRAPAGASGRLSGRAPAADG